MRDINVVSDGMRLCRLRQDEAIYLMMAPAMAGGWIAVHPDCREVMAEIYGMGRDLLALLPVEWTEGRDRPVSRREAERIIVELDRQAKNGAPREFAVRLRTLLEVE